MHKRPHRLHHSAVVVEDLAASREFYEEIMGLPLIATWCESSATLGEFCHAFFGLEDTSAVALFQFANEKHYQALRRPDALSPFHHLALAGSEEIQKGIRARADAADVAHHTIHHGFCVSLYLDDPDGHKVEVTYDTDDTRAHAELIRDRASGELERWLAGDHSTNNDLRTSHNR